MAAGVCTGAVIQCSFGMAPGTLMITPENKVISGVPLATIMDQIPMKHIMPFGMCSCPANPQVAAATAAALGVLTPMPCIPVCPAPWTPGSQTVLIAGKPALTDSSTLNCAYGGVIQIMNAAVTTVQVK